MSAVPSVAAAVSALHAGDLVAIPTETVYGLAADASQPDAVAKIFALKGRPPSRPLILHVASAAQLDDWAERVPDYARKWAATFWPGPLALVLPRGARVIDAVTGGQETVAIRVPDHPDTLALLAQFGGAVAAPSANRYGRISPTLPAHVRQEFGDKTPLILEGGACGVGIESTIVACLDDKPVVLRPGKITAAELARVADMPVTQGQGARGNVVTPGQDISHYAPATPVASLPHNFASARVEDSQRVGFLGFQQVGPEFAVTHYLPRDPAGAGRALYAALRILDQAGVDRLLIEAPPEGAEWDGLRDRLQRASAGARVVD